MSHQQQQVQAPKHDRPLWGSKWSGSYCSPWAYTYTTVEFMTQKIAQAPKTYRGALGNCGFLYEGAIGIAITQSNQKTAVNACRDLFQHSLDTEKQELSENIMLSLPEVTEKWHVLSLTNIEIFAWDGTPLAPNDLPSEFRGVFVAVVVTFEKDAQCGTIYRGLEVPVGILGSSTVLADKLKVAVAPKECTLMLQLWGVKAENNTYSLLSTKSVSTKKCKGTKNVVFDGPTITCSMKFSIQDERVQLPKLKEFARTLFRHLLLEVAVNSFDRELEAMGSDVGIITQWSGTYHSSFDVARDVFGSYLRNSTGLELKQWQNALDRFSVIVHMDKKLGVASVGCLQALEFMLQEFANENEIASIADKTRLCEGVDALLIRCLQRIAHPFTSFDVALLGSVKAVAAEVSSCIRIVKLVYDFEPWHTHTAATNHDDTPTQSWTAATVPILKAARKFVTTHYMESETESGYSREEMKDELVSEFGQNVFFRFKAEIDQMCEQSVRKNQLVNATGKGKKREVITRLTELLSGGDTTLSGVTELLVQEFGKKAVAKHRPKINEVILHEMKSRRHGQSSRRRRLETDLILQLERHLQESYETHRAECKPATSFEGDEIVHLMLIVVKIEANMTQCDKLFSKLYTGIDGFILSHAVFEIYGKLLAQDLQALLQKWNPHNGKDLAAVLFELYFAVRKLVESMRPQTPTPQIAANDLFKYLEWFEPFVMYWMRLSKQHAIECIVRSVDQEELAPVTSTELYSSSVLDIFKILFEMVQFYKDLKWNDKEAVRKHLAPSLAEILSASVKVYVRKFKSKLMETHVLIANNNNTNTDNCDKDRQDFVLSSALACALNNMDETLSRFQQMCAIFYDGGHLKVGSPAEVDSAVLFKSVESEIELCRNDVLHVIAGKIRPRIKADIVYLLYHLPKGEVEVLAHVDTCLGAMLDEPDAATLKKGMVSWSKLISINNIFSTTGSSTSLEPRTPRNDGYLCANLIAISQLVQREQTINDLVASIWGQALQALRDLLCSVFHPLPKPLQIPESPYLSNSTYEYHHTFPKKVELAPGFHTRFALAVEAVTEHLLLFFNDDGDGVPHAVLFSRSESIISHLLLCCRMTTSALIIKFLVKASTQSSNRIRRLEALARGHIKKKLPKIPTNVHAKPFPSSSKSSSSSSSSSSSTQNNRENIQKQQGEKVESDVVTDAVDPILQARRSCKPPKTPTTKPVTVQLRLRYDHEKNTAIVAVMAVRGLPASGGYYFKLRLLPRYNCEAVKLRSDRKTDLGDDEVFIIPNVSSGIAIQFRVQSKSLLQKQADTVIGETILGVQTLERTTRELKLSMPLQAVGDYSGHAGEALQLLRDRSHHDPEAKDFISMYHSSE